MEELEVADEESESSSQEDHASDCDSSISEKEAHLYSLIYHEEHTEANKIVENLENTNHIGGNLEFHVSSRSRAFRLNGVNFLTDTPPVKHNMPYSKTVRNHTKKVTAKLNDMKHTCATGTNEQIHPETKFSKRNQNCMKNKRNLCGSNIPSFCARNVSETDKNNKKINSNDVSCQAVHNSRDSGNELTEKVNTEISCDKTGGEKGIEISKYSLTLNTGKNLDSSDCVIVLESDAESVDSIIEVKPPTPPPPIVINIDSSDESSQIKQKKTTQKENIDPCPPSPPPEVEILSGDIIVLEDSLATNNTSTTPSENGLVVSYTDAQTEANLLGKDASSAYQSVDSVNTIVKTNKRKKKCTGSKSRRMKSGKTVPSHAVPLSWTSEMIRFYCHSWGGHKFDHEELQKQMPGNSGNWRVLDIDLLGPLPVRGPFSRSRCLNCNQIGHIIQQCPDPIRESCCCMCGGKGHTKRTCPNKICLQCGRRASKYSQGCVKCWYDAKHCATCGQSGHYMWLCPEAWRIYHSSTNNEIAVGSKYDMKTPNNQFCCNCARRGHTSRNCKFPSNEAFDAYTAQSGTQYITAFKYKNQKNNGHRDKFSVPNMNKKFKKNQKKYNITILNDPDPPPAFNHKKKKFSNTDRKRVKKKQRRLLNNKIANTQPE